MFLNLFSVRVIGGKEQSGGYVEVAHGKQYSLSLRNSRNVRCDARVEIDGQDVGTWRIDSHSTIKLERPAHDTGRFTFYELGTSEAEQAGLAEGDPNLGLVKVTFTPERVARPLRTPGLVSGSIHVRDTGTWPMGDWFYTSNTAQMEPEDLTNSAFPDIPMAACAGAEGVSTYSLSAGGTGLSGESGQRFYNVASLDYDYAQQTVIHLRLVHRDEERAVVRPLTSYSTQVPPAVG